MVWLGDSQSQLSRQWRGDCTFQLALHLSFFFCLDLQNALRSYEQVSSISGDASGQHAQVTVYIKHTVNRKIHEKNHGGEAARSIDYREYY